MTYRRSAAVVAAGLAALGLFSACLAEEHGGVPPPRLTKVIVDGFFGAPRTKWLIPGQWVENGE